MKLNFYLIPLTKINLKWIKDLNIRPETVKTLEENREHKLLDIGLGSNFLHMTPKAQDKDEPIAPKLLNTMCRL